MVTKGLKKKAGADKGKKGVAKYTIDCEQPASDNIIETKDFEKFLLGRIKVDGKTGNLGDKVSISREKSKVHVTVEAPFSKRYLKYLGKKYLKSQQLRDFLRIVAPTKTSYQMRYFNINDDKDEEEPDSALPLAQEALKITRRIKKRKLEAHALEGLAQVQQAREEHVEALTASREAISIFRELGDQVGEAGARHAAVSAYMGRRKLGEVLESDFGLGMPFARPGRALLVKSCAHKMAQEQPGPIRWEAKALHDVAELQAMRENFPAAMRAAKKAEQLVQETTDKSNIAAVLSTVAQIHLSNMVAEISKAPREEPDLEMIEETVQAAWRARDAAHAVYEEDKSERSRALLAPIAYLLAQTFLAIKDADEAMVHVEEGETLCNEHQDETGQIIGFILRSYVAILRHDMLKAKQEAEKANQKSKDIGYEFGVSLCEGIFDLVESSKDAEGGIPSAPPSSYLMPQMPDMPAGMPNMPRPRGPMPRPGPGMAMAPGGEASAAPAAAKPKIAWGSAKGRRCAFFMSTQLLFNLFNLFSCLGLWFCNNPFSR
ncbi:unnamed protein product [Effrenium voratum]|nr:unnamed protein product [Effrenium voratum]